VFPSITSLLGIYVRFIEFDVKEVKYRGKKSKSKVNRFRRSTKSWCFCRGKRDRFKGSFKL
jgi:hypothetical protein